MRPASAASLLPGCEPGCLGLPEGSSLPLRLLLGEVLHCGGLAPGLSCLAGGLGLREAGLLGLGLLLKEGLKPAERLLLRDMLNRTGGLGLQKPWVCSMGETSGVGLDGCCCPKGPGEKASPRPCRGACGVLAKPGEVLLLSRPLRSA